MIDELLARYLSKEYSMLLKWNGHMWMVALKHLPSNKHVEIKGQRGASALELMRMADAAMRAMIEEAGNG